ncbi:tartrate-resistant acid phosphatase type 5, partial [Acrasis kona]
RVWCVVAIVVSFICYTTASSIKFVVIGDWGRQGGYNQSKVAESMGKYCQTNGPCDFVVSTGDNIYDVGVKDESDKLFTTTFENIYTHPGLEKVRWYMSLGNHDYNGEPDAQIKYTKHSKRWYMPSNFYSEAFEAHGTGRNRELKSTSKGLNENETDRNVQVRMKLAFIDTNPLIKLYYLDPRMNTKALWKFDSKKQKQFLEDELSKENDWKVVIGHHSMYSAGKHGDYSSVKSAYKDLFEKHKVHVSFAGHDHNYQMLKNPNHPTTFVVSGSGSKIEKDRKQHKYLKNMQNVAGFNFVTVTQDNMTVEMIDLNGRKCHEFVVNKD